MQEESDKVVDQLAKAWWLTPNEKRSVMSYGVDEENETLNDYFIPANLIPTKAENIDVPTNSVDPIDIDVNKFLSPQQAPKKEIKGIKVATYENKPE